MGFTKNQAWKRLSPRAEEAKDSDRSKQGQMGESFISSKEGLPQPLLSAEQPPKVPGIALEQPPQHALVHPTGKPSINSLNDQWLVLPPSQTVAPHPEDTPPPKRTSSLGTSSSSTIRFHLRSRDIPALPDLVSTHTGLGTNPTFPPKGKGRGRPSHFSST